MESAMVLLLLVLVGVLTYILFSPRSIVGPWLDEYCKEEKRKWGGEDITPEYNTGQDKQNIHDAISQEKVPYTPALDIPFDDPEVPNRPSKKSKKKKKSATNRNVGPVKQKRTYKRKGKK
mgnify:CR=1 FL=1|tara:strand:+ start:269 stop:628 length:360 start_codon:yes stop_codon:yes gene_type:complete